VGVSAVRSWSAGPHSPIGRAPWLVGRGTGPARATGAPAGGPLPHGSRQGLPFHRLRKAVFPVARGAHPLCVPAGDQRHCSRHRGACVL